MSTRIPPLDLFNHLPQTPDHPNPLLLQLLDVLRLPFSAFGPFAGAAYEPGFEVCFEGAVIVTVGAGLSRTF
jgi:hypothetical protein